MDAGTGTDVKQMVETKWLFLLVLQLLPIVIVALVVGQHSVVASEVVLQVVVVDLLDAVDLLDLVRSQ
eukprot:3619354-Prorocentrum_lima.AAC.1